MKFIIAILFTAFLAFIAGLYMPWWSIALSSLLVALLIRQHAGKAFLSGFLALLLLWSGLAWWIDSRNSGVLSGKIAAILPLGGNSFLLILVTGIVAGLVAGFAAMSGSYLRASKS